MLSGRSERNMQINGISKSWLVLKQQMILILKCLDQVMAESSNYIHTKGSSNIEW